MPDSSNNVEILLKVRADGQAALAELKGEIDGLKTAAASASTSSAAWSERMIQASQNAAAWNASQTNLNATVGRTAASFAPATEAQRAFSLRAEETAVNAASLARGVDQMAAGMLRAVPGAGGLAGEVRALGLGAIGTAGQVGILNTVLIGAGIGGALAFATALAAIVTEGIKVQKTLQDLGEGVQGTLKSNTDFSQSQINAAGPASIEAITKAAKEAQVPITDLAKAFDQVFPSASRANTTIAGLSGVLAKLISEEDALHIPQAKIATDLEQIFNGSVKNTNQLAQQLGVTKEQAAAWREAGTTTEELTAKTDAFAASFDTGSETISRGQQKVVAGFQQMTDAATKDTLQPVTKALDDLAKQENDPAFQVGIANLVNGFATLVTAALKAVSALQWVGKEIVNVIAALGQGLAAVGAAQQNEEDQSAALGLTGGGSFTASRSGGFTRIGQPNDVVDIPTGKRPPVGGGGGGGGRGGGAGPSQDKQDQQEISDIMSQINEKQAHYNSLVEQNKVDHELGKTSLQQEQALIVQNGEDYGKALDQGIAKLTQEKQKIMDVAAAQGTLTPTEDKQINLLQTKIDKLNTFKAQLEKINAQNTFGGQLTIGLQKFGDTLQFPKP